MRIVKNGVGEIGREDFIVMKIQDGEKQDVHLPKATGSNGGRKSAVGRYL